MKRFLSIALAFVIAASVMGTTAFAARDDKIDRVRIYAPSYTVRVDRSIQLEERVYPSDVDYENVEWYSDDEDIAWVDEYGEVTGVSAGKVTITVRVYDMDGKRHSGNQEVTVTGSGSGGSGGSGGNSNNSGTDALDKDDPDTGASAGTSSSQSSSSQSSSASSTANTGGKIAASTVVNSVRQNVSSGRTTYATFRGYTSVAAATIKSAYDEMKSGGGTVILNFDTMSESKQNSVEGRVVIDPNRAASLNGDVQLGVYTNSNATGRTRTIFEKYFSNRVVIIKAAQRGNYGMTVSYAVKIGTELAGSNALMLYSYDPNTNRYYEIKNSEIWIDSSGYVHFSTHLGDDLVISDGKLKIK